MTDPPLTREQRKQKRLANTRCDCGHLGLYHLDGFACEIVGCRCRELVAVRKAGTGRELPRSVVTQTKNFKGKRA